MKQLIHVSGPQAAAEDQRLLRFAAWLGISTTSVSIQEAAAVIRRIFDEFQSRTYCLAMSAETLATINKSSISAADLQKFINTSSSELLVFSCTGSIEQGRALSAVTAGAITGVRLQGDYAPRFTLPMGGLTLSQQLAGLSFSSRPGELTSTFELRNDTPDVMVVMAAQEGPTFVRVNRKTCQIFLTTTPLADIDSPLSRNHNFEDFYHLLIPPLVFLRYCFRDYCWHNPEKTARLIIDDPVLSKKYGFLDYEVLMKSMERSRYGTSLAFIPWNHWRTSRQNTMRLLGGSSNLAICIHGCDHTNREFEASAPALLDRKAGLALRRMRTLSKRTGAGFEQVMVFPQGRFSTVAVPVLRANNYLAVVNTTCFPTDAGADDLKVGDLLRPAITRYSGFPIFQRHYPRRLFDFAFDLFLGKPALIAEHHHYFREGCGALEQLVAELYKLEPALSWPTLTSQLTRSCLKRSLSNGSVEVQFFTRRFQFANDELDSGTFLLSKHEPDSAAILSVLVDGTSAPFSFENGFLKLEITAERGQVGNIEIVDRERPRRQIHGFGVVHNSRVLLRRGLSEFRDNTLSRNSALLRVARGAIKMLKVTADA